MRIGLLFGLDNKTVLDYIGESDKELVRRYCLENNAPAVNTLMLSLLKGGILSEFLRLQKAILSLSLPRWKYMALSLWTTIL